MVHIVIDGMNAAHRFKHAHSALQTKSGEYTGLMFGFIQTIAHLQDMFDVAAVSVLWEGKDIWRYKVFPDYKIGRRSSTKTPEEVARNKLFADYELPKVRGILEGLRIPQHAHEACEADDLAGVIARSMDSVTDGTEVIFVTTDRDYWQLVKQNKVRIYNPITDRIIYHDGKCIRDASTVVAPSTQHYLWDKCMQGDSSDSLPGVPGIGKVRAAQVLDGWVHGTSIRQHLLCSKLKHSGKVLDSFSVVLRNKLLIDLHDDQFGWGIRKFGGVELDALERWMYTSRIAALGNESLLEDEQAFQRTFRLMEFGWAYVKPEMRKVLGRFRALRDRSIHLQIVC